jgi:hypothetical protein
VLPTEELSQSERQLEYIWGNMQISSTFFFSEAVLKVPEEKVSSKPSKFLVDNFYSREM